MLASQIIQNEKSGKLFSFSREEFSSTNAHTYDGYDHFSTTDIGTLLRFGARCAIDRMRESIHSVIIHDLNETACGCKESNTSMLRLNYYQFVHACSHGSSRHIIELVSETLERFGSSLLEDESRVGASNGIGIDASVPLMCESRLSIAKLIGPDSLDSSDPTSHTNFVSDGWLVPVARVGDCFMKGNWLGDIVGIYNTAHVRGRLDQIDADETLQSLGSPVSPACSRGKIAMITCSSMCDLNEGTDEFERGDKADNFILIEDAEVLETIMRSDDVADTSSAKIAEDLYFTHSVTIAVFVNISGAKYGQDMKLISACAHIGILCLMYASRRNLEILKTLGKGFYAYSSSRLQDCGDLVAYISNGCVTSSMRWGWRSRRSMQGGLDDGMDAMCSHFTYCDDHGDSFTSLL